MIRDKEDTLQQLIIQGENTVYEGENFSLMVIDDNAAPVSDVLVLFYLHQQVTDTNGSINFTAPYVNANVFYPITVTKNGYLPASTWVEVFDTSGSSVPRNNTLTVCVETRLMDNERFVVMVQDKYDNPVSDALVSFLGTSKLTDSNGVVEFTTPDVTFDTSFDIQVIKTGYESSSLDVWVINDDGLYYWHIFLIIFFILIVGIIAYFKYSMP